MSRAPSSKRPAGRPLEPTSRIPLSRAPAPMRCTAAGSHGRIRNRVGQSLRPPIGSGRRRAGVCPPLSETGIRTGVGAPERYRSRLPAGRLLSGSLAGLFLGPLLGLAFRRLCPGVASVPCQSEGAKAFGLGLGRDPLGAVLLHCQCGVPRALVSAGRYFRLAILVGIGSPRICSSNHRSGLVPQ